MKSLAFEIIGEILIIRETADDNTLKEFAEEKMKKHNYIKTAVLQISKVQGQERTRELKYILGDKNLETIHREYSCQYLLNPLDTFFSPRLSYERQRIANLVKEGEIILNFFAGVGPFSIAIAKKQPKCLIHSVEINQKSCNYMKKNTKLNRCEDIIEVYCGDAFEIIPKKFLNSVDRVLLPLPMESRRSLPLAIECLKGRKGIIHWQITEHIDSMKPNEGLIKERVSDSLESKNLECKFKIDTYRIVRWIAPKIAHIAIDLELFG